MYDNWLSKVKNNKIECLYCGTMNEADKTECQECGMNLNWNGYE